MVVAARDAYPEYERHSAYVCHTGRAFRKGLRRMAFYTSGEIQREVPEILEDRDPVVFSAQEAQRYRVSDDDTDRLIGRAIDEMLADGPRAPGESYQVFLLSGRDDKRTLVLPRPVRNTTRNRSEKLWAWTLGQRYTRSDVLKRAPTTTDELAANGG